MKKRDVALAVTVGLLFWAYRGHAADTTEAFDEGALDFELYLGADGIGASKYEKAVFAESLLGVGITGRLSGFLTMFTEGNERFANSAGGMGFGLLATPLDSPHVDVDLVLCSGFGADAMFIKPALELNFDARPDLALMGLYIRVEEEILGRDDSVADNPDTLNVDEAKEEYSLSPVTIGTLGAYLTMGERHQVVMEYDMAFHHGKKIADENGKRSQTVENGGLALGYNVCVTENVEVITELSLDFPNHGEQWTLGFMAGLVATIPTR